MYLDFNGLIVQKDGDGGDSAQRTGFYVSAIKIRMMLGLSYQDLIFRYKDFLGPLMDLFTPYGPIRNPIKYNDPKDFSRDQARPLMIACGLWDFPFLVENLKPKGFIPRYPNGDFASPENKNEYLRAIGKEPSVLGDLFATGDVLTRISQAKKDLDDVGDDVNTLLTQVFFYLVKPTSISKRNLKLYLEQRPTSYGVTKLGERDPVMGALSWYFRADSGGNPEIAEAWRPIILKLREMV